MKLLEFNTFEDKNALSFSSLLEIKVEGVRLLMEFHSINGGSAKIT